jgi:hypothetical protein
VDSCLANIRIPRLIHEKWPNVTLSEAPISMERNKLGFHWRSPLVNQGASALSHFKHFNSVALCGVRTSIPPKSPSHWRHFRTGRQITLHFLLKGC